MKIGLPDGTLAEFPDGTPKEVMVKAIQSYLMKTSTEAGIQRAKAGADIRAADIPPPEPLSTEFGMETSPETMKGLAALGAAYTGIPAMMATPVASAAGITAGLPSSYYGGKAAEAFGMPSWVGQLAGGMVGGITPALLTRKAISAIVAAQAAKSGGAPAMAALENALIESGWAPQQAKAFATAMGNSGAASAPAATMAPAVASTAPVVASAAPAVASAAPAVAEAALPATLSQQQLKLVAQLRGLAQNNPADKIKIAQAAQEMFPNSWQEILKLIMAPRTTMPTIHMP